MFRVFLALVLPVFISGNVNINDLSFVNQSPFQNLLRLDYIGYTCWLSCVERAAIVCFYLGHVDTGNASRPTSFNLDPNVNKNCQQKSTKAYGNGYDRGHLVTANHMDQSKAAIKESMYMTNILPQTSVMNQQAWLDGEEIFECYRDKTPLKTIVGIIMGNNTANDIFITSHGVRTPDYYWRIIENGDGDVIAWIMPNDNTPVKGTLKKFLVSIDKIEKRTGITFNEFSKSQKSMKANQPWPFLPGCENTKSR